VSTSPSLFSSLVTAQWIGVAILSLDNLYLTIRAAR
jgi:hypothetical protein